MYIDHLTVVPDGGDPANDTPAWNYGYDLCPKCASGRFVETIQETRKVFLDEDGSLHKTVRDSTLMEVWCADCGEVLHRA